VQISIPGYQSITADATVAGAFYVVDEASSTVTSLGNGDPGSSPPPPDTTPPTVAITAPATGTAVAAAPVSVSVAASDNIGISRVELSVQSQLVGSTNVSPYQFNWDASKLSGNVTLVAYAYDAAGNKGTSSITTVTVGISGSPLQANITSPGANSKLSGTVTLGASATELASNLKVSSLAILVDGKSKCSTTSKTTLSCSWNTKTLKPGNHTISATAKDTGGHTATTSITVTK
jgi:thermitase